MNITRYLKFWFAFGFFEIKVKNESKNYYEIKCYNFKFFEFKIK